MAKKVKAKAKKYEERIVLFIDFLGFKEHVQKTIQDPPFLTKLLDAMDQVAAIAKDDKEFHKSQRITHFSDCIVVSYRVDEESAVFWLLMEIAFCVVGLVEAGFLLRGALTVGPLHHSKKHVVGPALVEAYRMESKVAKYPRVLIDEKIIDVAKAAHPEDHDEEHEERFVRDFMTEDADGKHYFDYVSWRSVVAIMGGDNDGYPAYLHQVGELVHAGLKHDEPDVLAKYLWLHRQYLAAIDVVKALPQDHPYRLENPEECELIETLPTFTNLAASAETKVQAALQTS